MGDAPVRCPKCGQSDFYVLSTGAAYRGGTLLETYRWPREELVDDPETVYEVEQQVVEEPALVSVDGPVKALCTGCLADVTEQYLRHGRAESLPV